MNTDTHISTYGTFPELVHGGVHLWHCNLYCDESVDWLISFLSESERIRAMRFRNARDMRLFVVARAKLRMLLGRYLGVRGDAVEFDYGIYGKPRLADDSYGLKFNLSHTNNQVLFAFSQGREVGVDIEKVRSIKHFNALVRRVCCSRELEVLQPLLEEDRMRVFYDLWCRKEAYLKAKGVGITVDMNGVNMVDVCDVQTANDVRFVHRLGRWRFFDLALKPGYKAALVVEDGAACAKHNCDVGIYSLDFNDSNSLKNPHRSG